MRKVTLIPGDGIGPEISKSVTDIFEAAGVEVEFEIENAGEKVYNETGELIPESLYKSIEKNKWRSIKYEKNNFYGCNNNVS